MVNTPQDFVHRLAEIRMPLVFNPYRDVCPIHDLPDAPVIRQRNLVQWIDAAMAQRADTVWVARDLGYRGGRRTGLPLTDEAHLTDAADLMGGITLSRATKGAAVAERTAAVIWKMLAGIGQPQVLWNIFPFHPHDPGNVLSNRRHTKKERDTTWPFLTDLLAMIKPRRIIAIGRDAADGLRDVDFPVEYVRHPSYGGQADFIDGINRIYGIKKRNVSDSASPRQAALSFVNPVPRQ